MCTRWMQLAWIGLSLLGCSRAHNDPPAPREPSGSAVAASVSATPAPPSSSCDGLFDPPTGGVKLCDQHVLASDSEIHWTSWAVASARMDAFLPYQERARACGAGITTKPPTLSVSKDDQRLSVHEAGDTYPSCATKPPPTHASVVVISVKYRR